MSEGIEKRGIEKRGIEKGIREGILASIRNLMETMGWSAEQAMKALKISETELLMYANDLTK